MVTNWIRPRGGGGAGVRPAKEIVSSAGLMAGAELDCDLLAPFEFGDAEAVGGGEVGFAAKPVFHGRGEAVEGDARAGLEQAVGDGEGVVEDRVVGEVAHGEVVELRDGAGLGLAGGVDAGDGEGSKVHSCKVQGTLR